ncbi:MAG: PKD domain-containing protein [Planctomycetota bacterium]
MKKAPGINLRKLLLKGLFLSVLLVSPTFSAAQMMVGTNLDGIADWGASQWVDVLKQQRMWHTRNADGSGNWASGLRHLIPMNENGWPQMVPFDPGNGEPAQMVHTVLPVRGGGIYQLHVEGAGVMEFAAGSGLIDPTTPFSGAVTISPSGGAQTFDIEIHDSEYGNGIGLVFLEIQSSDPSDPLRNMKLISPGHHSTYEQQPFLPGYTDELARFRNLRFMDWGSTNSNPVVSWSERATTNTFTQAHPTGAAIEYQVAMANQQQQDAWFCVPAEADDDYIRNMARVIRDQLDPDLKVMVEYSNETWNFIFSQTQYVQDRGEELGLHADRWVAGQMFVAMRSAQIWDIFEQEFGAEAPDRLVKIMASQTGDGFLSRQRLGFLNDPVLNPSGVRADAIAIAPYFGGSVADELVDEGIVNTVTVDEILDRAVVSMRGNVTDSLIAHNNVAAEFDVWLVVYEGGQHLVGNFANQGNQDLTDKLIAANRSSRMYNIYTEYMDRLNDNGVVLFSNFSYVTSPSQYGSWGIQEDQDQQISDAHKLRAISDWITANPSTNVPPVARPGLDVQLIDADDNKVESVSLDGSASRDMDGQVMSFLWTLGGATLSEEATAIVDLPLGVHQVELTATDDKGLSATSIVLVTVAPASAAQVLVASDFTGTDPGLNTPWTPVSQLGANTAFSGWSIGPGLRGYSAGDVLGFDGVFGPEPRSFDDALANGDYLSFTVSPLAGRELDLRGAEFEFTMERVSYHAPRRFYVMSDVAGFAAGAELFATPHTDDVSPVAWSFSLPFDGFKTDQPVEFRIYVSHGQWAGHWLSLNGFNIHGAAIEPDPVVCPDSIQVTRGELTAGNVFDLFASDDIDVSIRRAGNDVQARTTVELEATSPTMTPASLGFILESSVFARSRVDQAISLMNFDTGLFESVDIRQANRFGDATVVADAAGDLSRFVRPGDRLMVAEIRFESVSQRQRFAANIDAAFWSVTGN